MDRFQDHIGYIVQLKSMKYARRLLVKWHNKEVQGQRLRCQIELDPKPLQSKSLFRSGSMSRIDIDENEPLKFDSSWRQLKNGTNNDSNTNTSRENNDNDITILDSHEFNHEGRIFNRYCLIIVA